MADKVQIRKLAEAFRRNLHQLKEADVPEAVIRQEYIDHFWELLGWDIHNHKHRPPAQKDVIIESSISTIEAEQVRSRRPDYIFRIDGFSRFVSEAKKLSIDLTHDKDAIFQAKTYAWNAQIPFAVLTNFEQFRLFDATIRPYINDPLRGIVSDFDLRFEDYENQWDIIESTFSREAVANGSLEALLGKIKKVKAGRRIRGIDRMLIDLRGSEPVDKAFLQHLEDYRLRIARAIYADNKKTFPDANTKHGAAKLTEATQRFIDRLVFIRVCEDRDVTTYGRLRQIVNNCSETGNDLFSELCTYFGNLDEQFNGYLFKAHFSEQLAIPAQLIADFIRSLYLPEEPYRFEAIGDDILGIIYERFLGSTITVEHNRVDATEKPEVRHAGGVYYTPKFVVDTIVRRVVGPKIEGKTPEEILNLTILDPACGSGSFLIAALQYLYDYCVSYIAKHPDAVALKGRNKKRISIGFKDEQGQWHLSPEFRSMLLASCIYGVDIDQQATEVTIMSLYLKLLEGKLPPHWQREFLRQKLLPPLDNNICCGNSLINQTDFDKYWENEHKTLFGPDEDTRFRINAFDWSSETQGFGRIFKDKKGFDCIIGNPPYIRVQELNEWAPDECEFYKAKYRSAKKGNYDIYVIFIEKALQLLNPDGLMGYICPHKFWQAKYGEGIREIIAKGKHLKSVIDFTDQQVFTGATTYTAIHVLSQTAQQDPIAFAAIQQLKDGQDQCAAIENRKTQTEIAFFSAPHPTSAQPWVFRSESAQHWCYKLSENTEPLVNVASEIFVGLQTSADTVFLFEEYSSGKRATIAYSKELNKKVEIESALLNPVVRSGNISRYQAVPSH
jgi:type I restriction-modification system DNA methylase subunit